MVIFDFDDTLLPTSSLSANNYSLKDLHEFDQLDIQCETVLKRCLEKAPVFIITNSENDWVRLSSLKYLPRTHSVILNNIDVVSARSLYESQYPTRPIMWKFNVFRSVVDQFVLSWNSVDEQIAKEELQKETNEEMKKGKYQSKTEDKKKRKEMEREEKELDIISFGDSEIERVALLDLQKMWNGKFSRSNLYLRSLKKLGGFVKGKNNMVRMNVKNIKFINNPTTEQIRKQLKTVADSLDYIFNNNGGLDLALQMNATDGRSHSTTPPLPSPPTTPTPSASPSPSPPPSVTPPDLSAQSVSSVSSSSSSYSSSSSSSSYTPSSSSSSYTPSSSSSSYTPSSSSSPESSSSTSSVSSPSPLESSTPSTSSSSSEEEDPSSSSADATPSSSFSMYPKDPPPPPKPHHRSFQALMRLPFHQFLPMPLTSASDERRSSSSSHTPHSTHSSHPAFAEPRYRQTQAQMQTQMQALARAYQGAAPKTLPTLTYSFDS